MVQTIENKMDVLDVVSHLNGDRVFAPVAGALMIYPGLFSKPLPERLQGAHQLDVELCLPDVGDFILRQSENGELFIEEIMTAGEHVMAWRILKSHHWLVDRVPPPDRPVVWLLKSNDGVKEDS